MTTEISVANREAIVFAADSASTFELQGRSKVSTNANKVFALSATRPIGLMVYNNALFMGVPWETVIKEFRASLPTTWLPTVADYADRLVGFLPTVGPAQDKMAETLYAQSIASEYAESVLRESDRRVQVALADDASLDAFAVWKTAIRDYVSELDALASSATRGVGISAADAHKFSVRYSRLTRKVIQSYFDGTGVSDYQAAKLHRVIARLFATLLSPGVGSGIVVGGFGEQELFPSAVELAVEGLVHGKHLKFSRIATRHIDHRMPAWVSAYAQGDMAARFMNGVDPTYATVDEESIAGILRSLCSTVIGGLTKYTKKERGTIAADLNAAIDTLLASRSEAMAGFIRERYSSPVTTAVSVLPRNELAALAEALVNLTSLKWRFSQETETVAGPTDVAVISRGDGLVWIKRKHYFDADLNPDFFLRRRMEAQNA